MKASREEWFGIVVHPVCVFVCLLWGVAALSQTPVAGPGTSPRAEMFGVRAQLETTLNSRTAQVGMPVEARPQAKMHLADGVDLDSSCRFLGRVVMVKASVDHSDSLVSVVFDRVRLKDKREIPVKITVMWIGPALDLLHPAINSAPADRTTPGVGEEAGGSAGSPNQGFIGSEITGFPDTRKGDARQSADQRPGVVVQSVALVGVNFFGDMKREESGFFRWTKGNVLVPGGTVMAFVLVVAPPARP